MRDEPSDASRRRINSLFLKRIKIESFGAFSHKTVGPFTPHLNVVFGNNETGKTTLSAFVGGVLFGWEEARGGRNTYKPSNAERSGMLFFENESTAEEAEFTRVKNADGLQGPVELIDDIDKETFSTMFALSSDELRSLKNTSDVTAKLLTAGSGTSASPALALTKIQDRIAEYTSRAAGYEHSLVQLKQRQEELRAELSEAAAETERLKKQDREFHDLIPQREKMMKKLEELNHEIETLTVRRATLEKLSIQQEKAQEKRTALLEEKQELMQQRDRFSENQNKELVQLSTSEEYVLRDHLDALFEEQTKIEHRVSLAKDNYAGSKASYEALLEADDVKELEERTRRQRTVQIGLSVALPLIFIVAGVLIFLHGREVGSLSYSTIGIGLICFSIVLASAAMVMIFRPSKADEALTQRKKDTQWVMLQDKKKLEATGLELNEHIVHARDYLNDSGFKEAHGSLKRARTMLDEAKDGRARTSLFVQKQQALISQLSSIEETLADINQQKKKLACDMNLKTEATKEFINELLEQKMRQRKALTETSGNTNRRYGELKQELSQAQYLTSFDDLKLAYQQVETRQQESSQDYARLLLAKRMLETAISAWESKSQPEVYKQASRLLSLMTGGRWVQVRMNPEGRLQIIDEVKTVREPVHLSLGTCQQLYLSLRIALLMTAENVGRIVPIMADDILVNFDDERRIGAIRALQELSERRQVIVFTCHKEIVGLMQSTDSNTNILEL